MSTSTTTNGRPERKQLSEQLDRFDKLLDGLADGLNDAIADAVRDGTRFALKDAIIEILTDPSLRTKLQQAAAPEVTPAALRPQGFSGWVKQLVANAARRVIGTAAAVTQNVKKRVSGAVTAVKQPFQVLSAFGSVTDLLVVGIVGGVVVAVISQIAPQSVATLVSGVTGGVASMAMRAFLWTCRTIKNISCV